MELQRSSIFVQGVAYPHYFLCHYLPALAGRDTFSRSVLKFKQGRQPDLSGLIDCALKALEKLILPGTLIVRALYHDEIAVRRESDAPLDRLGMGIAARCGARYAPSVLQKSRATSQIKDFTKEQREAELKQVYEVQYIPSIPPALPGVLLIDDILTTGATIRTLIATLRPRYPQAGFQVFTLAKAAYDPGSAQPIRLEGPNYELREGMDWMSPD